MQLTSTLKIKFTYRLLSLTFLMVSSFSSRSSWLHVSKQNGLISVVHFQPEDIVTPKSELSFGVRHFSLPFTYKTTQLHPNSVFSHTVTLLNTPFHNNVSELQMAPMSNFHTRKKQLVHFYQTAWQHISEDGNHQLQLAVSGHVTVTAYSKNRT
jgi:hypothetical protein